MNLLSPLISFDLGYLSYFPLIGIDEAGRGPLAGPLVVAGVKFKSYHTLPEWVCHVNDSKKLSSLKRRDLFFRVQDSMPHYLDYSINVIDVCTVDKLNILEATMEGMRRCIDALYTDGGIVLVDGNRCPVPETWCRPVVKGDSCSLAIATASILAKVYRDNLMIELAEEHPQYGWERNAGYGTAAHLKALRQHGVTPYHRKSFAPIRNLSI